MKLPTILGIILVVIGLGALIFKGIPYQSEESNIQLGPIEAEIKTEETFPLPRVFGIVATAAGVILIVGGSRFLRDK